MIWLINLWNFFFKSRWKDKGEVLNHSTKTEEGREIERKVEKGKQA